MSFAASDRFAPPPLLDASERRTVQRCLAIMGFFGTASLVGVAFSLYLVSEAPLLLVALSPLGRHLVLAAPVTAPLPLGLVLIVRRLCFYATSFHLGRALGPSGIPWIEERAASLGRFVRFLERLFERSPRLVVLFFAGPTTSALAGVAGMRMRSYLPLATLSLVPRTAFMLGFAEWMREPLEVALAWIDEYRLPGTLLMLTGVLVYRLVARRRAAVAPPVVLPVVPRSGPPGV